MSFINGIMGLLDRSLSKYIGVRTWREGKTTNGNFIIKNNGQVNSICLLPKMG